MNDQRKESTKLCDVVLRIDEQSYAGHRAVLASCSAYFYAMFNGELAESKQKIITMKDILPDYMQVLVEFAYTGRVEITVENVQNLLATASLLQFHEVKDLCCQFLESQLDPSNCLGIRKFTESHGCCKFLEVIDKYVLENFKQVMKSEEYALLPSELLVKVISSDDLNIIEEEEVFEAVMNWIRHDLNTRVAKLPSLIRYVRMPLISKHYLLNRIDTDSLIRSNLTCRDLLDEAKNYHLLPDQRARFRSDRMRPRKSMMGTMFAIGGKEAGETISNTTECYSLQTNTWQSSAPLIVPRQQLGVGNIGNRLYAVGGSNGYTRLSTVEMFTPESNKWTYCKSLNTSRSGVGLGVLGETLYALGGYDGRTCLKTVERYDPQVDCWSSVASTTVTRSFPGVAELGGRLFVIGGNDGASFLNSVECYDPLSNKWTTLPSMCRPRAGIGAGAIDGLLFAIGGFDGMLRLDIVEMFESRMNTWTQVSPLKSCRDGVCVAAYGCWIYAVGGIDGPSYLNTVEAYDPKTDLWETMPSMSRCRAAAGVVVLPPI
ncbi:predicted protein [Nematostella vectensis]|uniref:BTB domain-containing protein n=3 Tax=Nematostella vectensis TaxID=45351 RepID=A7SDY1_NEMVE|nr:predicted protein [Nematostella vectensis]|eukprot:XP_001630128.1 predicted protein [Nematostella vectensis]